MENEKVMRGRDSEEWLPEIMEKASPEMKELIEEWNEKTEREAIVYNQPFDVEPIVEEPQWEADDPFAIKVAPIGAYMTKEMNPNVGYTTDWIRDQLMESVDAGACAVHVHVRNPDGTPTLDPKYYHEVIDPIKEKYGKDVLIDGCPEGGRTLKESMSPLIDFKGVAETSPISLASIFWSNTLFATPKETVQAHVDIMQELDQKPELCLHDVGSIDQARDWLFDTGIYKQRPVLWRICIGEPHTTCFHSPKAMFETYNLMIQRILEVEPDSVIEISQCGHGGLWQLMFAALYGPPVIGVRMGMEDSMWEYPHKDEVVDDNPSLVEQFVDILESMGRRPATASEFREMIGDPLPELYD